MSRRNLFLPFERDGNRPWPREDLRILDRRLIPNRVRVDERVALDNVQASLWKFPAESNHVRSLWLVTSTTSVSPSQWPRESPIQNSSGVDGFVPLV